MKIVKLEKDTNIMMQESKRKPNSKTRPYNKSFKWTLELHMAFEKAVKKLGAKAKPSQILKEMNVPSLKREQVSSHLQVAFISSNFVLRSEDLSH